jgi:hypothetical protein
LLGKKSKPKKTASVEREAASRAGALRPILEARRSRAKKTGRRSRVAIVFRTVDRAGITRRLLGRQHSQAFDQL